MRALSSRVSSVKSIDNLKKSVGELRFLVLTLPQTKIFTLKLNDADASECLSKFNDEYSTANGADQQLAMVNTLIRYFTNEEPWILNDEILGQMLSDLLFHAPLKHPIRNAIVKALQKETIRKRSIVPKSILNSISECNDRLIQLIKENAFDMEDLRAFHSSLGGYFDNFEAGVSALEPYFLPLLQTLHNLIDIYLRTLNSITLSPAKRSEFYVDLHNVVRVVLSCVQQYQNQIIDSTIIQPILTQCWDTLLENPIYADLPMDTKINCGILKIFYDRMFKKVFEPRDQILEQFQCKTILSKDLFYAIAIINTILDKDFMDSNFYVVQNTVVNRLINVGTEYTMDSCILMSVTRALVQYSKKILTSMRRFASEISTENMNLLKLAAHNCLKNVWLNVQHSIDCVRYLINDLLRNLLQLGHEYEHLFGDLVTETFEMAKFTSTNESLICLLLDYLSQVLKTERVLIEIPDIQQRILKNIFKDLCWSNAYERLMLINCNEIGYDLWCDRWIKPLLQVHSTEWRNDFNRLKIIRNLFERALKTKSEVAEYILSQSEINIEIYLFVLWTMRRSGRKIYAPENYRASSDEKVLYAKIHPLDEMRILAFRILIECHKVSERFPIEDLNEILDFFRYNCNSQNPTIRQQIETTLKRAMVRLECGYAAAKRTKSIKKPELCIIYEKFLRDLIEFCVDWCLFDGSNFGRRTIGLSTLLTTITTWQKLLPDDRSIYTEKLWIKLQQTLADSYVVNKDAAIDILFICWQYYTGENKLIHDLNDLKRLTTTFRPYDTMTAAHYLVFCAFSKSYFKDYFEAIIWCENLLDEGLKMAKVSLMQAARYNALFGSLLSIRHLFARIDFVKITNATEIQNWRSFFERIIRKWTELTDVMAQVVNSSAPEGHLPADLNDSSHFVMANEEANSNGYQIKLTPQIILLCAWRTVRESSLLLGEIALRTPVITLNNPNGLISVNSLLQIGLHFQRLLAETKHRGAFEQTFVGFTNLCLRLWRSNEPELHSCPMRLVRKIAATIAGETVDDEGDAVLDLNKLCATRRSAGIPFMIQGIVATEVQVCSSVALTFCMTTFLHIAKTGVIQEARTHSLNILRALFRCTELGEAVCEYISDGIECSIRGYSAASWPERNSSTLLFSALMIRVFGVQRSKEIENISIKNKMTGRIFFLRHPKLYDFFYTELKSASESIQRNERPPRLHPLLLIISRLYPSALEGSVSNLKLSTYIPVISTCSSSPELVTRQLSAKSMTALIPPVNIVERLYQILNELKKISALNAIHGYLLQIFYLLRSFKQQDIDIDAKIFSEFLIEFSQVDLHQNNVLGKTYLEILLEILFNKQIHPINENLCNILLSIRYKFLKSFSNSSQYNQLTQSYVQKPFTIFNLLLSTCLSKSNEESEIIDLTVSNTQNELLETQLNIMHLLFLRKTQRPIVRQDYSRYEIEFVDFIRSNEKCIASVVKLLPSINSLNYIVANRKSFYPYGTIKTYEILSMLLKTKEAFEQYVELQKFSLVDLLQMVKNLIESNEIDEIGDPMWKFINAHLLYHRSNTQQFSKEIIALLIKSAQQNAQPYKTCNLRCTATETLSILSEYFASSIVSADHLIQYVDLIFMLLRDDDVNVRNQTAEIVLDLITERYETSSKLNKKQVIPLAAEDYLFNWLEQKFQKIVTNDEKSWELWLKLLRLMSDTGSDDAVEQVEPTTDHTHLVDVDIFEIDEPNTFDEFNLTQYKCFSRVINHLEKINGNSLQLKMDILNEFPALKQFFE